MSQKTGGDLDLTKPEITDEVNQTITDLAGNAQKTDDVVTAHLADETPHAEFVVQKSGDSMTGPLAIKPALPAGIDTNDTPDKWPGQGMAQYTFQSGELQDQPISFGKILHIASDGVLHQFIMTWNHPEGSDSGPMFYRSAGEGDTSWGKIVKFWDEGSVEYGSNANGEYVRYPNGVQTCYISKSFTGVDIVNDAFGSYRNTAVQVVTYPAAFSASPGTIIGASNQVGIWVSGFSNASTVSFNPTFLCATSGTYDIPCSFFVIGRWK